MALVLLGQSVGSVSRSYLFCQQQGLARNAGGRAWEEGRKGSEVVESARDFAAPGRGLDPRCLSPFE